MPITLVVLEELNNLLFQKNRLEFDNGITASLNTCSKILNSLFKITLTWTRSKDKKKATVSKEIKIHEFKTTSDIKRARDKVEFQKMITYFYGKYFATSKSEKDKI